VATCCWRSSCQSRPSNTNQGWAKKRLCRIIRSV
jgi:hypothetical protein